MKCSGSKKASSNEIDPRIREHVASKLGGETGFRLKFFVLFQGTQHMKDSLTCFRQFSQYLLSTPDANLERNLNAKVVISQKRGSGGNYRRFRLGLHGNRIDAVLHGYLVLLFH
ncbi:uncharacterized protein K452DRAFT_292884 [Aplosporella prunicola CBS 121167]|uniref:Uncharacterized protein n=1 Tax=Aplosporella prunicola CBS 121167 TaxID=1176127 RepID=A0A6A6AX88_9PEZI|nr:uncharacterized protein K452DRAFT_292884 [Aplosporella prunicola CBS 121167]KAF2135878.1 hypothetical protein K452DRAFT_292884 [Aplosporella prunicola CBS 121167]